MQISGWGLLGENTFDTPDQLNELRLRTVTRKTCEKMFYDKGFDYEIRNKSLSPPTN